MQAGMIGAAWREPFSFDQVTRTAFAPGTTLAEMAGKMPLPAKFWESGIVCINGHETNRLFWHRIKPKPEANGTPVTVTFHMPLQDGGGQQGGGKGTQVLALVATLALTAFVAPFIIEGGLAFGGLFGAGTLGAKALAGAVTLGGALAVSALSPPPTSERRATNGGLDEKKSEPASADGNILAPGNGLPRVVGTRKVFPPYICEPLIDLVGKDEVVEAIVGLDGPHALNDIRINDAPISDSGDIESETKEGWRSDTDISIVTRYGRTREYQAELSRHDVKEDDQAALSTPLMPEDDLPEWHSFASKDSPDEIWLSILLAEGLHKVSSTGTYCGVPLRIQFRKRGESTWNNCPEIHLTDAYVGPRRRMIRFKWATQPVDNRSVRMPTNTGFTYAHIAVPAQTTLPATGGWTAHADFDRGSGNDYTYRGVEGATAIQNVDLSETECVFYLDENTFPKGIYDIRVKRGCWYEVSSLSKTAYTISGTVYDLFEYYNSSGVPSIPVDRSDAGDRVAMMRLASVFNTHPVQKPSFALIAVKATGRQINSISVEASGYVPDYDGSTWSNWTTTANPAPHYRYILNGGSSPDPIPTDLIDDDGLVAWRTDCATNGWACNATFENDNADEVLKVVASCGYARPYQSEIYGVVQDKDRSSDSPVQIFTPHNMRGFSWSKAFARRPDGFIVSFRNEDEDYDPDEVIVYSSEYPGTKGGRLEAIEYRGVTNSTKAQTRATYDLDQARLRDTFYNFDAPADAIVCRRGDLIGIQHEILMDISASGRIADVVKSSGTITEIVLDGEINVYDENDMSEITDMSAITDWSKIGAKSGIAIRNSDGTVTTHAISNSSGRTNRLTLTTPITNTTWTGSGYDDGSVPDIAEGCLVSVGLVGTEYKRCVVLDVENRGDIGDRLVFGITAVDEAPDLDRGEA